MQFLFLSYFLIRVYWGRPDMLLFFSKYLRCPLLPMRCANIAADFGCDSNPHSWSFSCFFVAWLCSNVLDLFYSVFKILVATYCNTQNDSLAKNGCPYSSLYCFMYPITLHAKSLRKTPSYAVAIDIWPSWYGRITTLPAITVTRADRVDQHRGNV